MATQKTEIARSEIEYPIVCLTRKELIEMYNRVEEGKTAWNIPLGKSSTDSQREVFSGFEIFSPGNVVQQYTNETREPWFFLSYIPNKERREDIVGVLKLCRTYDNFAGFKTPPFQIINFVETRADKRNRGICRSLFKRLGEVLTPNDWLVGTDLEPLGREAKLNDKLRERMTCPYFESKGHFYEYCRKNGLLKEERR